MELLRNYNGINENHKALLRIITNYCGSIQQYYGHHMNH